VASHTTAAWLWGLLGARPGTTHVTATTRRHAKASIRLHFARLHADDRTMREGIPVTSLPRTFLDLAAILPSSRLDGMIERAERTGLFDLDPVEALLARTAGHPGNGALRRALALYRNEPAFTRSRLELRFLDLVRRSDLPMPSTNAFVEGHELDAYWPQERFAVELDGYEFHRTRAAFERDRLRQEELKLAGVEMIRVTSRRIDEEPQQLVERIGTLLKRRHRALVR
jgi:hypothetical protein